MESADQPAGATTAPGVSSDGVDGEGSATGEA